MPPLNQSPEELRQKSLVLVVDDQPRNLQLAASVLSPYYRLLLADSGQKCLHIAAEKQPDLILLDVMLPGLSGYEVCAQLKAEALTRDIPVIFLTARTGEEDLVQAFEVGAVDYLTKPFRAREMLARLKTHISLRQNEKFLQQYNAFKDRILTIVGHDLRGPIGTILNLVKMVQEDQESLEKEDLIFYFGLVQDSTAQTMALLNNLLEWGERGQLQPNIVQIQPLDFSAQLEQVLSQMGQIAQNKGISIHQQVPRELQVQANANMLQTILRNLLSNSIKFTEAGKSITVSARQENGIVEIAVADQGVGIKPEIIEKLLSKTSRYTSYGTDKEKGFGLGLNLCLSLIEQLGGWLSIESEPGKGSTFRFSLPAVT